MDVLHCNMLSNVKLRGLFSFTVFGYPAILIFITTNFNLRIISINFRVAKIALCGFSENI